MEKIVGGIGGYWVYELVFEGPVSRLEKDRNWTGLDRKKTGFD